VPLAFPRPSLPREPFAYLRQAHATGGLAIDAGTAYPRGNGDPVDYDLIVQGLVLA